MRDTDLLVCLYYNRGHSDKSGALESYSLKLRPDFTLVIRSSDSKCAYIVNFDAKYRLKTSIKKDEYEDEDEDAEEDDPKVKYLRGDMHKMHTYRDALVHSCGSYVLFPGDSDSLIVYKKLEGWRDLESSKVPFIPSVGAIPLTPGKDSVSLRIVLDNVLKDIPRLFKGGFDIEDPRAYWYEDSQ